MGAFQKGERRWVDRLGNLRNVVRQEVIARQLADHVAAEATVLDVGCGQGTQALRLALMGSRVTGIDPSPELLARFRSDAARARVEVELIEGNIDQLDALLGGRVFDVVCAHGVLMYLDDRAAAIAALARRVDEGGRLSITFRNGHALAFRPGLRRAWPEALAALTGKADYVNELGVAATAHRLEDVESDLAAVGFEAVCWFGVRVFNDGIPADMGVPANEDLAMLLDVEDEAGRLDPYRWIGAQLHVIAAPAPTRRW